VSTAPWAAHFGLARTPFGKSIAARDLFARQAHAEAIARISFCVVIGNPRYQNVLNARRDTCAA
jgi:type II secretory pathway predicted ATPase ExeA